MHVQLPDTSNHEMRCYVIPYRSSFIGHQPIKHSCLTRVGCCHDRVGRGLIDCNRRLDLACVTCVQRREEGEALLHSSPLNSCYVGYIGPCFSASTSIGFSHVENSTHDQNQEQNRRALEFFSTM